MLELLEQGMPADVEAERLILGVILLDNTTIDQAMEKLKPWDFFNPSHHKIFAKMVRLAEQSKAIDPLILQRELEVSDDLVSIGGPAYIASLFSGVPRFSDIRNYVNLVADCSLRRRQIAAGNKAMMLALDREGSAQEQLNKAQKLICDLESVDAQAIWADAGSIGYEVLSRIEEHQNSGKLLTGLATGFTDLDMMTGGLQKGDLIVLGGRPSMGKTGFAGSLIVGAVESESNLHLDGSRPVIGFFSVEMKKEQIVQRWLCSLAAVNATRVRGGLLGKDDWRKLAAANLRLQDLNLEIDDSSNLTPMMMRSRVRQLLKRRKRIDLIVVDYLQAMSADNRSESKVREVGEISHALKAIAKDFNVPVVALASLSRKCEDRTDKRPMASDLRESGDIESDADVIAFLYSDFIYNPKAEPLEAELIVRKHRNGPIGTVPLIFEKHIVRFSSPRDLALAQKAS